MKSKAQSPSSEKCDAVVIGAAKSGTTWLFECLRRNESISVPSIGETDFFTVNYGKGLSWFHNLFEREAAYRVDISPSYFSSPDAPARIYKYNPEAKIVVLIRDPLERAYSHYRMEYRGGVVDHKIDKAFSCQSRYVQDSLYFTNITRYLEFFPRDKILVLRFADISKNPMKVLKEFYSFIGVQPSYPDIMKKKIHGGKSISKFPKFHQTLASSLHKLLKSRFRLVSSMVHNLRDSWASRIYHKYTASSEQFPKLSGKKEEELVALFEFEFSSFIKSMDNGTPSACC